MTWQPRDSRGKGLTTNLVFNWQNTVSLLCQLMKSKNTEMEGRLTMLDQTESISCCLDLHSIKWSKLQLIMEHATGKEIGSANVKTLVS